MTTPTNTSPSRGTAQSLATPPRYIIPRTTPVLHPPPPGMLVKLQNSVTLILHIFYIALLYSTVCTYVLCQFSFIGCLFSHTHQKISHVTVMWHHMSPVFVFLAHQSRNVLEPSSLASRSLLQGNYFTFCCHADIAAVKCGCCHYYVCDIHLFKFWCIKCRCAV